MSWQFTVGVMAGGKDEANCRGAEDALVPGLEAKLSGEATTMYVRRLNQRNDHRNPPHVAPGSS